MTVPSPDIIVPSRLINATAFIAIEKETLSLARHLKVEPGDYRVVSYSATVVSDGVARNFHGAGERLPEDLQAILRLLEPGKILLLENILLETPAGETAVIPWFVLRVK